jgi:hypothetical protein
MRDVIFLLLDLIGTLAKLAKPGGSHALIAENPVPGELLFHQ